MYRHVLRAAALILAVGLQGQAVRAQDNPILKFLLGNQDPRLTAAGIGIGIAGTGASYALTHKHGVPATRTASPAFAYGITSFGCAVVYPIIGTIVLHRELTPREAYSGIAGCFIPFIGAWLVDQTLPHTAWNDGTPPGPPPRHHHYRHHAKSH
jgi:hypothetical protein